MIAVADWPTWAFASTAAPFARSSLATEVSSTLAAAMSGVIPVESAMLTSAPRSSSSPTTVAVPLVEAATSSGVLPNVDLAFTSAPPIQQQADLRRIARGPVQRGDACIARGLDVRPGCHQQLRGLGTAEGGGQHQRRLAKCVLGVGPVLPHQRSQQSEVVVANGLVEPVAWSLFLRGYAAHEKSQPKTQRPFHGDEAESNPANGLRVGPGHREPWPQGIDSHRVSRAARPACQFRGRLSACDTHLRSSVSVRSTPVVVTSRRHRLTRLPPPCHFCAPRCGSSLFRRVVDPHSISLPPTHQQELRGTWERISAWWDSTGSSASTGTGCASTAWSARASA